MRSTVFGEIDVHMPLKKIVLFFFTDSIIIQLISILKQSYQSYNCMHAARTSPRFNKNVFLII